MNQVINKTNVKEMLTKLGVLGIVYPKYML